MRRSWTNVWLSLLLQVSARVKSNCTLQSYRAIRFAIGDGRAMLRSHHQIIHQNLNTTKKIAIHLINWTYKK